MVFEKSKNPGQTVPDDDALLVKTEMKINPVGKRLTITDDKIGHRKHVILLGDITADVNMVERVTQEGLNLISIGFLNRYKDFETELARFKEVYDIVVANDGGWDAPLDLLKRISFEVGFRFIFAQFV